MRSEKRAGRETEGERSKKDKGMDETPDHSNPLKEGPLAT